MIKIAAESQARQLETIKQDIATKENRLDQLTKKLEDEIDSLEDDVKEFRIDLGEKLGLKDGKKIWEHLQRFCEYSDLKDLYQKCIPQLAKFEQKMIDYTEDYNRIQEVIGDFDK